MSKHVDDPENILSLPLELRTEMALTSASRKLVAEHLRDGSPLYVWRNGRVVAVPPQEFQYLLSDTPTE